MTVGIFIFREISTDYQKIESTIQKIESKELKTGRTIAALTGGFFAVIITAAILTSESDDYFTIVEYDESETW